LQVIQEYAVMCEHEHLAIQAFSCKPIGNTRLMLMIQ